MKRNRFNKSSGVMNGPYLIKLSDLPWRWMNTRRTRLQSDYWNTIYALLILKNTHYLRIISIEAQINELANPAPNEVWAHSLHCLKLKRSLSSLLAHFVRPHWKYTNRACFVCHFDECLGHFHRVQMWGSRDPSWFQESIGVHKGRVSVHLLAWRDTEAAQKERETADLILGLCVCACVIIISA